MIKIMVSREPNSCKKSSKAKADPYSPENMDRWVYETLKEEGDNFPTWHLEDTINDDRINDSFA